MATVRTEYLTASPHVHDTAMAIRDAIGQHAIVKGWTLGGRRASTSSIIIQFTCPTEDVVYNAKRGLAAARRHGPTDLVSIK